MNFSVLAISGKGQSGKTTTGDYIKSIVKDKFEGYSVDYMPFAGKLKQIATDLFGWDGDKELYYNVTEKFYTSGESAVDNKIVEDKGRQLLINIGGKMREIRPSIWIDFVVSSIRKDIENSRLNNKIYLIDDLRYKNELNVLRQIFGNKLFALRINRNNSLHLNIDSETDLDNVYDWDYTIANNGTLGELLSASYVVSNKVILQSKNSIHSKPIPLAV